MSTLKVRDRTTNTVQDALVNKEDFERLKDNKYLTDKNSKEPFREIIKNGKRQRIALKRDVMGFQLGDPRRVCYIDKTDVFDCRRSNLSTKNKEIKLPVVKIKNMKKEIPNKEAVKFNFATEIKSEESKIDPIKYSDVELAIRNYVRTKLGCSNCTIQIKLEI